MLDGVHLTLLIGPLALPMPAPLPLTEALQSVEVTAGRDRSGFQIAFSLGKMSPLQTMLAVGFLDPMITRVVVVATMRGIPNVIMDGVVTRQEMPSATTRAIDAHADRRGPEHPDGRDRVQIVLSGDDRRGPDRSNSGKYAMFGVMPVVIPPLIDTPESPTKATISQTVPTGITSRTRGPLRLRLLRRTGPGAAASLAYFGPDVRLPIPQPALFVNSDWATNVESLSFSLDGLAKSSGHHVLDPITKKFRSQFRSPTSTCCTRRSGRGRRRQPRSSFPRIRRTCHPPRPPSARSASCERAQTQSAATVR